MNLGGKVVPPNAEPQHLRQESVFELAYVDRVRKVKDGSIYGLNRVFETAHSFATIRTDGLPRPQFEERAEPYEGHMVEWSRLEHTRTWVLDEEADPMAESPWVEADDDTQNSVVVALTGAFRFPHAALPVLPVRVGDTWTISANRIGTSNLFGRFRAPTHVRGQLTGRLVRVSDRHVHYRYFARNEDEKDDSGRPRYRPFLAWSQAGLRLGPTEWWGRRLEPCAEIQARGRLEIRVPDRAPLDLRVVATYVFSLENNIVISESVDAVATIDWRRARYRYTLRGPYRTESKTRIIRAWP